MLRTESFILTRVSLGVSSDDERRGISFLQWSVLGGDVIWWVIFRDFVWSISYVLQGCV